MRKVAERIEPGCACAALHAGPYGLHMLEICSLGTGLFFSGSAPYLLGGKEEEEQVALQPAHGKVGNCTEIQSKIKMLTRPAWNSGACKLHLILY